MIRILNNALKSDGDIEIRGECSDCGASNMDIFVLSKGQETTLIIQVDSWEGNKK